MNEIEIRPKKEFLKILIVEDDSTVAELVTGTLQAMGHHSIWCPSAEEALALLGQTETPEEDFDLIYLDIQLPRLNGIEFCHLCRNKPHPRQPSRKLATTAWIVAMTSLSHVDDVIEMLTTGANDYLTKPVTAKTIQVKTTVCWFASARNRALQIRIRELEKQIIQRT